MIIGSFMINVVSSKNARLTLARKLSDKKYRDQYGLFAAEGEKLVKDALRYGLKVEFILCSRSFAEKHENCGAFGQNGAAVPCFAADDKAFGEVCDTVSNQGVLAVVAFERKEPRKPFGKCLLLDGIRDPANVGAVLRTAAASGYDDVYLCESADPFSAKSLRAGMSAQYVLNIFEGEREKILDLLSDCQLICADMSGENVFSANISEKHALVLGNEGSGVSRDVRMRCDKTVSIPMKNDMESLNVAVSAGILMYMLGRKNL